jgi:hypothetical protein
MKAMPARIAEDADAVSAEKIGTAAGVDQVHEG